MLPAFRWLGSAVSGWFNGTIDQGQWLFRTKTPLWHWLSTKSMFWQKDRALTPMHCGHPKRDCLLVTNSCNISPFLHQAHNNIKRHRAHLSLPTSRPIPKKQLNDTLFWLQIRHPGKNDLSGGRKWNKNKNWQSKNTTRKARNQRKVDSLNQKKLPPHMLEILSCLGIEPYT